VSEPSDTHPADEPTGSGPLSLVVSLGALAVAGVVGLLGFRKHRRDRDGGDDDA